MKLTIVRHGETVENAKDEIMGQRGGTLSEKGIKQSKKLAEELKNEHFDKAWSSDLTRCLDTAKYIVALQPKLQLQTTSALREVNYGIFQGRPSAEIQKVYAKSSDFVNEKVEGGESHFEMFRRTITFINELFSKYPTESILIITHTGPIEAIRASVEKAKPNELFPDDMKNAGVWRLEVTKPLVLYPKS